MAPSGKHALALASLGLIAIDLRAFAAEIIVTGNCVGVTEPRGLLSGARAKGGATYESAGDQVLVTVCSTANNEAGWRVDVKRRDVEWPRGLRLFVRCTGGGSGVGSIFGGQAYVEVGPTFRTLYCGAGDRSNVPLQFRLTGVSLRVPVGTHAASILYTLVDTGG